MGAPPLRPDATQDEIDAHWLAHVYRPHEPQATPRALAAGCVVGGVMSIANLYIGMKAGPGRAAWPPSRCRRAGSAGACCSPRPG